MVILNQNTCLQKQMSPEKKMSPNMPPRCRSNKMSPIKCLQTIQIICKTKSPDLGVILIQIQIICKTRSPDLGVILLQIQIICKIRSPDLTLFFYKYKLFVKLGVQT